MEEKSHSNPASCDPDVVAACALLHDVGIKISEEKHGYNNGETQEQYGPPVAAEILAGIGFPANKAKRVKEIIGNHHSPSRYDYPELAVLKEADQIVNAARERGASSNSKGLAPDEALTALSGSDEDLLELMARADAVRRRRSGDRITTCSIINAKSGGCPMDCRFCAQSSHSKTNIQTYQMLKAGELIRAADELAENHPSRIGIVTSGETIDSNDQLDAVVKAISVISSRHPDIELCASLGALDEFSLLKLKESGLDMYHHNLETAPSFYPKVCSTRSHDDKIRTVKLARRVGLKTCSGGLFGLGESDEQRIELFSTLIDLKVDSTPINFFHPFEGMRVDNPQPLPPLECLRLLAVARLMMPDKEIRLCGGREHHLRDLQAMALFAGIDGIMIGGYLTLKGRDAKDDVQMIADAGRTIVTHQPAQPSQ